MEAIGGCCCRGLGLQPTDAIIACILRALPSPAPPSFGSIFCYASGAGPAPPALGVSYDSLPATGGAVQPLFCILRSVSGASGSGLSSDEFYFFPLCPRGVCLGVLSGVASGVAVGGAAGGAPGPAAAAPSLEFVDEHLRNVYSPVLANSLCLGGGEGGAASAAAETARRFADFLSSLALTVAAASSALPCVRFTLEPEVSEAVVRCRAAGGALLPSASCGLAFAQGSAPAERTKRTVDAWRKGIEALLRAFEERERRDRTAAAASPAAAAGGGGGGDGGSGEGSAGAALGPGGLTLAAELSWWTAAQEAARSLRGVLDPAFLTQPPPPHPPVRAPALPCCGTLPWAFRSPWPACGPVGTGLRPRPSPATSPPRSGPAAPWRAWRTLCGASPGRALAAAAAAAAAQRA
jgi:hypothetical protein